MIDDTGGNFERIYLSYNGFVPKNLTKRLDRVKQSMVENGIDEFFWTFARFTGLINFRVENNRAIDDDEMMPKMLGLEQLSMFFILYIVQMIIAIVVFITELYTHRLSVINDPDLI